MTWAADDPCALNSRGGPSGTVAIVRFMPCDDSDPAGRGLALARDYFLDVVEPLLDGRCQGVPYVAARVGAGSEVLLRTIGSASTQPAVSRRPIGSRCQVRPP
jgi:hypothetical protein